MDEKNQSNPQKSSLIEIDASSGGQAFRTAIALSAFTGKGVVIRNIRKNRPKPGLQPQHLTALILAKKICRARVKGFFQESRKVEFIPNKIVPGIYTVNIGTAGSITLLMQSIMLPLFFAKEKSTIRVFGGTDVPFAPTINYFSQVFSPMIAKIGFKIETRIIQRGYYPKGNGLCIFTIHPATKTKTIELKEKGKLEFIKILSHSSGLPSEVSANQAKTAKNFLLEKFPETDILEETESNSQRKESIGSGTDIIAKFENTVIGANYLGEKGKIAEKIGLEAAKNLIKELESNAIIDSHLQDQLIPFLLTAKQKIPFAVETEHAKNNSMVCEKFFHV